MTAHRLSSRTLREARGAELPDYDRTAAPSIVHIGVGGFARGHLGTYADDLLRAGWSATIQGVSLRGRGAEDQLAPQDCLYTVLEREPDGGAPPRVIGALTAVATGPEAAIAAIAAPDTSLVTLTVTEKGYEVGDNAAPSAPGVVAAALARRRTAGLPPPVVASLDNLLDNGRVLRDAVLEAAGHLDSELVDWIDAEVRFPSSVVDRMVPATTADDRAEVAQRLGLVDQAAVVVERHRSWVIEAVDGLPPLGDVGVEVVGDVDPFQRRKLWLLNGPHSALAYGGLLAGCETIAQASAQPAVAAFVQGLVDEVVEVAGEGTGAHAAEALRRFRNPSLGHTCRQVGADGSRKLAQRLLPVVAARRRRGLTTDRFALVVAMWLVAVEVGAVEDPGPAEVPGDDAAFAAEVRAMLERVRHEGAAVLEVPR